MTVEKRPAIPAIVPPGRAWGRTGVKPTVAVDPRLAYPLMAATLVKWMGIEDANSAGFVHGGTVMKLCDEVAGLAAIRHSQQPACVTAGMDRMTFLLAGHVGELLTLKAHVNAAWRTSMEVGVRVEAENVLHRRDAPHQHRLPDDGRARRRRQADRGAAARAARPTPSSGASAEAQVRRANRLAEREQILRERS